MSYTTEKIINDLMGVTTQDLHRLREMEQMFDQLHKTIDSIDAEVDGKFERFHAENPHVFEELRKLALKMRRSGRKHYGMKGLFEVLRWHRALETTDGDFKLNNNYTSFYARLLMDSEPELEGFFRTRKAKGEV